MKTLFYLLLSLALFTGCSKDDDSNDKTSDFNPTFAKILQEKGYISDSKRILYEEVKDIDTLDVSGTYEDWQAGKGLTSLAGIEHFESLTKLYCHYNQLTSLDVSKNTALIYLECRYNQLTSLNVSKNTALTGLDCSVNKLTSLDVSRNTALTWLDCWNNQLTSLDVSQNTALTSLNCSFNQLTSLDVNQNTALTKLLCSSNQLTSLDVSKNTALIGLECSFNQLTSLDVSQNTALTYLNCSFNQLTSLDINKNTDLTYLYCHNNPGDGKSLFPVTAWFDNEHIPEKMKFYYNNTQDGKGWTYYGDHVTNIHIDFRKAE